MENWWQKSLICLEANKIEFTILFVSVTVEIKLFNFCLIKFIPLESWYRIFTWRIINESPSSAEVKHDFQVST